MQNQTSPDFIRVPPEELESEFYRILVKKGFHPTPAKICAGIFTGNSLDGVYSHGVNRFAKFILHLQDGHIRPDQEAVLKSNVGNLEQWDGQSGPGPVNAMICTDRAIAIAAKNGIGCVALANTNHWLRGGTYGWKAAKAGFVFIGWSNTIANMPAWGAVNAKLGNNPLILAVPYQNEAIILDMAMSQYSYGALEFYEMKNEKLAVPGGYDERGKLTQDASAIRRSQRSLPIGYWKGAGLSMLLDIVATILSGGLSTTEITKQGSEFNLSQVFIAIDISKLGNFGSVAQAIDEVIADYRESQTDGSGTQIRYPGEKILATRAQNTALGIPVLRKVWEGLQAM